MLTKFMTKLFSNKTLKLWFIILASTRIEKMIGEIEIVFFSGKSLKN